VHARILALNEDIDGEASRQICDSLGRSGHRVIQSKSFALAIDVLKTERVDLIISDVHLQNGGSVFDFLRWVKGNPLTKDTPFVLFSLKPTAVAKYVEDAVRACARVLGASMYITMEPFDTDKFRKLIDSLLPADEQLIELSPRGKK